jgi:choline dehydrogenase-like flavoprotein
MQHNSQEGFAERVRANQQKLSSELRTSFDYIVVGAGTSGSVVAARLASDPETTVPVLEAGGTDETDHSERNHQGLDNALICPEPGHAGAEGEVHRRERLGGLLNYYYRKAA